MDLGIQLYTFRDEAQKDFVGVLEKVTDIGYKNVEFCGYWGLTAAQLVKHMDRLGLKCIGSHVQLDQFQNNIDAVIDFNKELGNKYVVYPWHYYEKKQDYMDMAYLYNKIGEKCRNSGLQFCYHNHAHELKNFDDECGMDIILRLTDPEYVKIELDTYWIQLVGIDPVGYIEKLGGRCPLVHQKDMGAGEDKPVTEIGNGIMDIVSLHKASEKIGATGFIIEQDTCTKSPFECVSISYSNLKKMGIV